MEIRLTAAILSLFSGLKNALRPRFFYVLRDAPTQIIDDVIDETIAESIESEESRTEEPVEDDITEEIRRSPAMASLFPCLYHKHHLHPVGMPHTCNSFLLGPEKHRNCNRYKIGAHMFYVSKLKKRKVN